MLFASSPDIKDFSGMLKQALPQEDRDLDLVPKSKHGPALSIQEIWELEEAEDTVCKAQSQ